MKKKHNKIIFYDGECGICNGTVRWIKGKKKGRNFQFIPLQFLKEKNETTFKIKLPENFDGIIFLSQDSTYLKSNAVIRILFELHPLWNILYPLLWIPYPVRDFFYDVVARNRHRFFKEKNRCDL